MCAVFALIIEVCGSVGLLQLIVVAICKWSIGPFGGISLFTVYIAPDHLGTPTLPCGFLWVNTCLYTESYCSLRS
jgi:hypothetical protein